MRKFRFRTTYVFLGFLIAVIWMVPKTFTDKLRYSMASFLSVHWLRPKKPTEVLELQKLRQENAFLRVQLERARAWLTNEQRIEALSVWTKEKRSLQKRLHELAARLDAELRSMPAQVVLRDPASWSSTLWIDVGNKDNEERGARVIAVHSPVLVGNSLIGVVEYVGTRCSRVRLITDPKLVISVCGSLGKEHVKGEVQGSGASLWRSRGQTLIGMGFLDSGSSSPLVFSPGDVLVTSGLDGVFPQGLYVGVVVHADEAREGSSHYAMEIQLQSSNVDDLSHVSVLPSSDVMVDGIK